MFDRILHRMRKAIRERLFVVSRHADEEMYKDGLTVIDVENAVLAGGIRQRQRDQETGEWKYIVRGKSFDGEPIEIVAKWTATGYLLIITVYRI